MCKKILLAESSQLISKNLKSILESKKYEVQVFQDGKEALNSSFCNNYDLIISNIYLKTVSGIEFCTIFKNSSQFINTPFILYSIENEKVDFYLKNSCAEKFFFIKDNSFEKFVEQIEENYLNDSKENVKICINDFIEKKENSGDLSLICINSVEKINYQNLILNSVLKLAENIKNFDKLIYEIFETVYSICNFDGFAVYINNKIPKFFYSIKNSDFNSKEDFFKSSFYEICENDFKNYFKNSGTKTLSVKNLNFQFDNKKIKNNIEFSSYKSFQIFDNKNIATFHIFSEKANFFDLKICSILEYYTGKIGRIIQESIEFTYSVVREKQLFSAFSKYVPKEIIEDLLKSDTTAKQTISEKRNVAILICDIRNFTSISEINQSENVVNFLNIYFTKMVEIIKNHGGSIDKFMGDAIMAVFGAPISYVDNAKRALDSALEMVSGLNEISFQNLKFPENTNFDIGIGIHYGEVIVGNIGCKEKSDYTVIGDSVNLSSRLEGLTKQYGSRIIVSQSVKENISDFDNYNFLQIDKVKVKGKNKGVEIFRVDNKSLNSEYVKFYQKGLNLYIDGAFNLALPNFKNALEIIQNDKSALLMKERCEYFLTHPQKNWDGIITLTSK